MTRRIIRLIASVAIAVTTALAVSAGPAGPAGAEAAQAPPSCPANYICLFADTDFEGRQVALPASLFASCGVRVDLTGFYNNTESTYNNTGIVIDLFDHRGGGSTGHANDVLAGRAAAHRAYSSHLQFNNTIDHVVRAYCGVPA